MAPCAVQRLAGPPRRILDFRPLPWIVKRAKDDATDQRQAARRQRFAEDGGILGHEADGAELDAVIARGPGLVEDALPRRVAGIVGKLNPP